MVCRRHLWLCSPRFVGSFSFQHNTLALFCHTTHCKTLRTVTRCVMQQHAIKHCNTMQRHDCAAFFFTHCNTLYNTRCHIATRVGTQRINTVMLLSLSTRPSCAPQSHGSLAVLSDTHCNTPQHTATHRNTPQHTATRRVTLQHMLQHTLQHTLQRITPRYTTGGTSLPRRSARFVALPRARSYLSRRRFTPSAVAGCAIGRRRGAGK